MPKPVPAPLRSASLSSLPTVNSRSAVVHHQVAGVGQFQLAPGPAPQRAANGGFKLADLRADGLRGDVQALARRTAKGIPTVVSCTFDSIRTVLLHDSGEAWAYGVNVDWLGRVVEQQRGKRLGEVM